MLDPMSFGLGFIGGVVILGLIVAGVTWQGSKLLDEGEPRELVVTRLTSSDGPYFTADLDHRPSTEARGKTAAEAVGTMVLANPEEVGVTVKHVNQVRG